jgi:HlyD family secretion protein
MSTNNPSPDVIDVIPVLKSGADVDAAAPWSERLRAAWPRLRWALLAVLLLATAGGLAWRATRPSPFVLVGQVEAQEINVLAPAAGLLTRLHVLAGQQVAAGGPLFEMDAGTGSSAPAGSTSWQHLQPGGLMRASVDTGTPGAMLPLRTGWPAVSVDPRHIVTVASPSSLSPAQAGELAQARADLERQRLEVSRFERSAELAYATYQRAVGLFEDSMIESAQRDAALSHWKTADTQARSARARLESARQRVSDLIATLPAQAASPPSRAPAQTGERTPATHQALPAAQGLAGSNTAAAPSPAPAPSASAAAAAAGAGPSASAPAVADGAGAPARGPALTGRLVLRAPVAGEVNRIAVKVGSRIAQGQWLMSLLNLADVWVVAVVREDHLPDFAYDSLHKADIPQLSAQADFRVEALTQLPDFATWRGAGGAELRSFEVRLRATSALPGLRPGMPVLFSQPLAH